MAEKQQGKKGKKGKGKKKAEHAVDKQIILQLKIKTNVLNRHLNNFKELRRKKAETEKVKEAADAIKAAY